MKLIINTVNLQIGGAFQRSVSFLKELKEFGKDQYHVFYNKNFAKQVDIDSFPENFTFYYFEHSPASLKYRKAVVKEFNKLEREILPDVVFSFVGPCYWRTKRTPHLVGYGVPHIVYDDYKYVRNYGWKTKLEMIYKKWWTKHEADYYVVQTEDVRERLAKRIRVDIDRIFKVSNGIGKQYSNVDVRYVDNGSKKKLLTITTYRPSKNLEVIKDILPFLSDDKFTYEFHLTIKEEDYFRHFSGYEKHIINHGHVNAAECPELYNQCDAMFLPSHLECFSASYPEAMKMERPILTSDLSFAHTVCKNAAVYFDSRDPKDIAEKIKLLFHNNDLVKKLVANGKERLGDFDTSRVQAEKYLMICKEIISNDF